MVSTQVLLCAISPHPCVGRSLVPFYDVRFKGFGYNKQLQILQLVKQRRFRLMVRQ